MLAERGIDISCETIRRWILKFGSAIAANVISRRVQTSGTWHLDEVLSALLLNPRQSKLLFWGVEIFKNGQGTGRAKSVEAGRASNWRHGMTKHSPFRYFKTSPESQMLRKA